MGRFLGKFLLGVLMGVVGSGIAEVLAGPEALKAKLDKWTSEEDKEKYPSLHRYWDSKTESNNPESEN